MKKIIITGFFCLLVAIYIFAQAKKHPSATPASVHRGQQVFSTTCIVCHQKNGGGVPNLNPPLIKTSYVLGDQSQLIQIVLKGLNKPIEVEGQTYNNVMPSFAQLTDAQIADVLTYVRNSFGNKASAIKPSLVKAERDKAK